MAIFNTVYGGEYHLPWTYQKVEYIQSSWTQYIDTWYLPSLHPKIDITLSYIWWWVSWEDWLPFLWRRYYSWWQGTYFAFFVKKASPYYISPNRWWFDPWTWSGVTISKNTKYHLVDDQWELYLDGVLKSSASTTNTISSANYSVYLFDLNEGWSRLNRNTQMRIYSCSFYNEWILERDFVPCYRKSDNVVWLYDLVNRKFYTNSWSWTFTKWSDV